MKKGQRRYKDWKSDGFPGWLQAQIITRDWSAADLAREAGVTPSLVSRWMKGQRLAPDSLKAVAKALNLPFDEVWRASGEGDYLPDEGSPEQRELHHLLDEVDLTHERYLTLRALLTTMLRTSRVESSDHHQHVVS